MLLRRMSKENRNKNTTYAKNQKVTIKFFGHMVRKDDKEFNTHKTEGWRER